jgi:phytoene dehydrogenase-like protein
LALDRAPQFTAFDAEAAMRGRLLIAPSLQYLERAYNHAKYGEYSAHRSWRSRCRRCAIRRSRRRAHVLSAIVQYAPLCAQRGLGGRRAALHGSCASMLERTRRGCERPSSPELLTPADIEREFRISGGHWHHGELAFDQFFMVRPVPGAAQHRTPLGAVSVRRRLPSGRRRHGHRRPQCRAPGPAGGCLTCDDEPARISNSRC